MAEQKKTYQKILAQDIMSDAVDVVKKDMLVHQVAHRMLRERVSGYPVVDDYNNLVGMITITDLLKIIQQAADNVPDRFAETIARTKNQPISSLMAPAVVTVSLKTTLEEIVRIMLKKNIHTFPVMEHNKLAGIIGRHDVLNAVFVYG